MSGPTAGDALPREPEPADDLPHEPGPEEDWAETGCFAAASPGPPALYVEVTVLPRLRRTRYLAVVVPPARRPPVLVADADLGPPRPPCGLEVRGPGLWADHVCEEPLARWTLGLEAAGLVVADPTDAAAGVGLPLPAGLDLEMERSGPPRAGSPDGRHGHHVPATVLGELLTGEGRWEVDAPGWWAHRWGPAPWGRRAWVTAAAGLAGTPTSAELAALAAGADKTLAGRPVALLVAVVRAVSSGPRSACIAHLLDATSGWVEVRAPG